MHPFLSITDGAYGIVSRSTFAYDGIEKRELFRDLMFIQAHAKISIGPIDSQLVPFPIFEPTSYSFDS